MLQTVSKNWEHILKHVGIFIAKDLSQLQSITKHCGQPVAVLYLLVMKAKIQILTFKVPSCSLFKL